jgi:hypothetical protein
MRPKDPVEFASAGKRRGAAELQCCPGDKL